MMITEAGNESARMARFRDHCMDPVFGYHPTVIVGVDCIRIHTDEYV